MIEFRMPSLGADMEDGTLREWNVKVGDLVKRGQIIAVVETQKGLIEIEIFEEGKIDQLLIKEDEKVPVGTVMALLTSLAKPEKTTYEAENELQTSYAKRNMEIASEKIMHGEIHERIKASPLAKRIAAENKIDISTIKGTGEDGVITKEDVEKLVAEKVITPKEKISSTESIRMAVAAAMSKSNRDIPHYYLEMKIDMSNALVWLNEENKKRSIEKRILPVVLLIKAVAKSLTEVPELNAVWDNGLQKKTDINIGFVISLRTGGLMIPSIHNADKKSLDEIMDALNDIIPRARNLKLRSSELSESTVTITNLGDGGADKVYGVIYPPQVAIIGFGSISEQPYAENGMLDVRPALTATLAGDHRATDGHTGSRFLAILKNYLLKPETL